MKTFSYQYRDIEFLKERQKLRILQQELTIRKSFRDLNNNLTGESIRNKLKENLFSGYGIAYRLGFLTIALLTDVLKRKRKKKSAKN